MATKKKKSADGPDQDLINEALEQFRIAEEAESKNRTAAKEDIDFARLGHQWPDEVERDRKREGRPMLTINRMPSFCRQVVNDARMNKPTITTRPATGGANVLTANLFDGLIRQIQNQSSAGIAYDTGIESAVYGGFGYWRVDIDYAYNDSFDLDIMILPVENPLSVYGDPTKPGADSRDWNFGFVIDDIPKSQFEIEYPDVDLSNFSAGDESQAAWVTEKAVRVAEWWKREPIKKTILKLSDGSIIDGEVYVQNQQMFEDAGQTVVGTRETKSHKVTHRVITGANVLETTDWKGCYIPIIPVYGDVINQGGERHFRSLVRDAKDPQRMFNFWRTAATEIVALAPRVPYIGARGAFNTDAEKWATINRQSHAYLEYDPIQGMPPPQRQPLDGGVAAGALQEAASAADDMKSVMGLFDASLGARSNETSGRAIMARQREGDVSTFHFIDNRDRAIEHTGRILVDLIPHIYTGDRMVTVLSEDLKESQVQLGQPLKVAPGISHVFDLNVGKYSLVMKKGLSYTSKREEAAQQMIEFAKVSGTGPLIGDFIAKNMDWPYADQIEQRIKKSLPPHISGEGPSPQEQQMQQAIQQLQEALQQATQELQALKADKSVDMEDAKVKHEANQVNEKKVMVESKALDVESQRLDVEMRNLMMQAGQVQGDMQAAGMNTTGISTAINMLQQQLKQVVETVSKPKRRIGRAVKQADGSYALEATEVPAVGAVQ